MQALISYKILNKILLIRHQHKNRNEARSILYNFTNTVTIFFDPPNLQYYPHRSANKTQIIELFAILEINYKLCV